MNSSIPAYTPHPKVAKSEPMTAPRNLEKSNMVIPRNDIEIDSLLFNIHTDLDIILKTIRNYNLTKSQIESLLDYDSFKSAHFPNKIPSEHSHQKIVVSIIRNQLLTVNTVLRLCKSRHKKISRAAKWYVSCRPFMKAD